MYFSFTWCPGARTADELSKITAFFYYGAAKPPCLSNIGNTEEPIPAVQTSSKSNSKV